MEIKPIASPDARTLATKSVHHISFDELAHLPLVPVHIPDMQARLKELGRLSGFFVTDNKTTPKQNGDMRARDAIYGVAGQYVIDDYPQADFVELSRADVASMTSMALGSEERKQIAEARIVQDWERPSANNSLSTSNLHKTVVVFDKLERESQLDLYIAKTDHHAIEVTLYQHQAAQGPHLFPYRGDPLRIEQFGFDPVQGLKSGHYPYPLPAVIAQERVLITPKMNIRRIAIACAISIGMFLLYMMRP
jgi:hypothetical protein